MDIVDQILKEIPFLLPYYKESLDDYGHNEKPYEDVQLPSKLGVLNMAYRYSVRDSNFKSDYIETLLTILENFAQEASEDELGYLEVMFFEGLVWWAEDKEDEYAERYGDYFLSHIGPKCRELVKRNEAFWKIVNKNKQDSINKHYAELQADYDKRMALKNK